jgi:hypothetical protein
MVATNGIVVDGVLGVLATGVEIVDVEGVNGVVDATLDGCLFVAVKVVGGEVETFP